MTICSTYVGRMWIRLTSGKTEMCSTTKNYDFLSNIMWSVSDFLFSLYFIFKSCKCITKFVSTNFNSLEQIS